MAGGRLSVVVDGYAAMAGAVAGGVLKPLAISAAKRLPYLPDLPTVGETIKDFHVEAWFPLMAPAGTPNAIVQKISKDLLAVLAKKELQDRLAKVATYTHPMTPEELGAYIASERAKWLPAIERVAKMAK